VNDGPELIRDAIRFPLPGETWRGWPNLDYTLVAHHGDFGLWAHAGGSSAAEDEVCVLYRLSFAARQWRLVRTAGRPVDAFTELPPPQIGDPYIGKCHRCGGSVGLKATARYRTVEEVDAACPDRPYTVQRFTECGLLTEEAERWVAEGGPDECW
jgi:hypothetical protein